VRRGAIAQLVGSVVITAALVLATLAAGNEILLGLDLQGGVSVVLQPVDDVDEDRLDQAVEIMRNRIDSLGVAEPEITTQGDTILVQIPGIDDQDRAIELIGQTAELRFRPVLRSEPAIDLGDLPTTTTAGDGTTTTAGDGTTTSAPGPETTLESTTSAPASDTTEAGMAPPPGESASGLPPAPIPLDETGVPYQTGTTAPPTTAPAPTTPLLPPTGGPTTTPPTSALPSGLLADEELTGREGDTPEATVILPQRDDDGNEVMRYQLGPAALTGESLESARALLDPTSSQWAVIPNFKSGSPGIDDLNAIASQCFSQGPTCPTGQLAIVLDGEVISAPSISQPSYERDSIQISGEFSEGEAKDLATVLNYGALPVELEPQAVQVVSATVGEDALRAGLIAGIFGLVLASLYMFVLYRLLGVVAVASLVLTAAILYAVVAWLSASQGLALTLAGVTGLIVSIGVSLDSNIVYFEHLKEDVRNGRTIRSAVDRSFQGAFRTILAADMVSLIGAATLYFLTIGAVRGFALFLGLATILDLFAAWFFMRPAVLLLGRWKRTTANPALLGLPEPKVEAGGGAVSPTPAMERV
jgi:preprotein translocase subunit SecD